MDKTKQTVNAIFSGIVAIILSLVVIGALSNDDLGALVFAAIILIGVIVSSTVFILNAINSVNLSREYQTLAIISSINQSKSND